jgi:hypothetical protein
MFFCFFEIQSGNILTPTAITSRSECVTLYCILNIIISCLKENLYFVALQFTTIFLNFCGITEMIIIHVYIEKYKPRVISLSCHVISSWPYHVMWSLLDLLLFSKQRNWEKVLFLLINFSASIFVNKYFCQYFEECEAC